MTRTEARLPPASPSAREQQHDGRKQRPHSAEVDRFASATLVAAAALATAAGLSKSASLVGRPNPGDQEPVTSLTLSGKFAPVPGSEQSCSPMSVFKLADDHPLMQAGLRRVHLVETAEQGLRIGDVVFEFPFGCIIAR